jgi:ribonuclease BN (tRNA processing enzyme)
MTDLRVMVTGSGSPRPSLERANSGQVVFVGERPLLVDCGGGTTRRLVEAGLDGTAIDRLFFTHLHSDHTLDYAEFVLGTWAMGRASLALYGPPGTARLHQLLLLEPYREDIEYRLSLGRSPAGILDIAVHEIGPGVIYDDGELTVRALEVVHSTYTLALRFDHAGRSLVISGDTAYHPPLIDFARGADILIHDCCLAPARALDVTLNPAWANLADHLRAHHATPEEAGRIASAAGVRTLVLTHFLFGLYEDQTRDACAREFDGEMLIGHDGLTVAC